MSPCLDEGLRIGRYTFRSDLARGGMADDWLASAEGAGGFQKSVVIKTILPRLADDPYFVRMFIEEALVAAKLSHPNVIHILDLGESACSHFIAMEYIAGETLTPTSRAPGCFAWRPDQATSINAKDARVKPQIRREGGR